MGRLDAREEPAFPQARAPEVGSLPQVELEEDLMRKRAKARTGAQWVGLWVARIMLNLLVLALLGAAFYGVYWATDPYKNLQVWARCRRDGTNR